MIDINEMSILIVDDMEGMTKSIRGMLKVLKYGNRYHFANNGREALGVLEKHPIDFVITDWNMPIMTGVELLGAIREDRELREMPVVMITAESNREIVAEAAETDIDSYILKPLTVKSLGTRIAKVVEKANNPPPMVHHLRQAKKHEDSGDLDAAIEEAELAAKAEPASTRPIRELGDYFYKIGDLEEAEKHLLKAAGMNKLDVIAFHRLAKLYLDQDDIENAAIYFDKAMTISPRHVERGIEFGRVLVQKGLTEKAVSVFDKAISLSEGDMFLREDIADLCHQNGMYKYSLNLMGAILNHQPDRFDLMFKMGVAHKNLGDRAKALQFFLKAEEQDQENIDVKLHIARIYSSMGKIFMAEEKLKFILKLDPDHEEAKELFKANV